MSAKARVARAVFGASGFFALGLLTPGCGTEGQTPRCEGYPAPYDVRVAARRAEAWEQLAEVPDCATLPAGFTPGAGGGGIGGGPGGVGGADAGAGGAE